MTSFLENVVKRPAIISGNSSGGLIAIWLGANRPDLVHSIIAEDPPLFSADWPRIKSEFVYYVLKSTGEIISVIHNSDSTSELAKELQKIQRPKPDGGIRKIPSWAAWLLAWIIRLQQKRSLGGKILNLFLPKKYRQLAGVFTRFDPDFSQSWVDGRIYEGLDHAEALSKLECPVLLLHANWYQSEKGLMGAMSDKDAARARSLIKDCEFKRLDSEHVVHSADPDLYINLLKTFVEKHKASNR